MKFAKKSLGQNFLIDKNIIKKIISTVNIRNKNIIEIGPGKGALTEEILKNNPKSLTLIEKDNSLLKILKLKFLNFLFLKESHFHCLLQKKDLGLFQVLLKLD